MGLYGWGMTRRVGVGLIADTVMFLYHVQRGVGKRRGEGVGPRAVTLKLEAGPLWHQLTARRQMDPSTGDRSRQNGAGVTEELLLPG